MARGICTTVVAALMLVSPLQAVTWRLGEATLIHEDGTRPSNWNGTVSYLNGTAGAVMFYDGFDSFHIYGPDYRSYEPANAGGTVAWRNYFSGPVNEIYRWDGQDAKNISDSPTTVDCDVAGGANGDVI